MPASPKIATNIETVKDSEVGQVVKWIISGAGVHEVYEAIQSTYPETVPAALMKAAMLHLEQQANFDPLIVRGWCFEASRDLYRKMVESGDFVGALRAVKMILEMAKDVHDRPEEDEGAEQEGEVQRSGTG